MRLEQQQAGGEGEGEQQREVREHHEQQPAHEGRLVRGRVRVGVRVTSGLGCRVEGYLADVEHEPSLLDEPLDPAAPRCRLVLPPRLARAREAHRLVRGRGRVRARARARVRVRVRARVRARVRVRPQHGSPRGRYTR